ncbi:MAG TPA: 4Fe-4S dicluster domain-containing protein [Gaiellaceae bacterium]|nr:4Fe-4S dicluster domain-containing protein [Gaiellaceae bacterium]
MHARERVVVQPEALDALIGALRRRGYTVVGPTLRDGAIVYEELESGDELPVGWTDRQEAGTYRLERRADEARFGYAVGPHSWKRFLFPPRIRLWQARRNGDGAIDIAEEPPDERPLAFVGVRACDLHAIAIQDRVLLGGRFVDRDYASRREGTFVVAVNCFEPGGTCFCVSMGTGPRAESGFDIALTEILDGEHRLLAETGSELGAEVLAELPTRPAVERDVDAAEEAVAGAAARMGRTMEAGDLRDLLADNLEHPRWDDVADRCLTCGNCVLVCPTCFCSTVEDHTDLTGDLAERWRTWDTCFSVDHSYIHGGSVRPDNRSRYRQWMTHKLGTWHDQFGTSGCVGCGRCITWCPVGIDITEEVAAIRGGGEREHAPA